MPLALSTDLASARYSTAAITFIARWQGQAAAQDVRIVRDGDFTTAEPNGRHVISFPFASEGDAVSQIVIQRFWQLGTSFRSQALGTVAPNRSDLLLINEENFKDEGGGIISWDRVYATLPRDRDVFEDYAYGFQYFYETGSGLKLSEKTRSVASRVRFHYFHIQDLGRLDLALALRFDDFGNNVYRKRGAGNLTIGATGIITSTDVQIVAEDSKFKIWKYPIMELRTRFVAGPTDEFWGETYDVPN